MTRWCPVLLELVLTLQTQGDQWTTQYIILSFLKPPSPVFHASAFCKKKKKNGVLFDLFMPLSVMPFPAHI